MRLLPPRPLTLLVLLAASAGCAHSRPYHDRNMDFGSIRTVAVLPFWNLTSSQQAADRVRDVFSNALLATDAVYVVPAGEVGRAVARIGLASATAYAGSEPWGTTADGEFRVELKLPPWSARVGRESS